MGNIGESQLLFLPIYGKLCDLRKKDINEENPILLNFIVTYFFSIPGDCEP
jgi:hypothetical protein